MSRYFLFSTIIFLALHASLSAQEQNADPPPAFTVQTTPEPPAEEYVYWANHIMGVELDVFRLRVIPADHQTASTTDFRWSVGMDFVLGRIRSEGWSPFFRYFAFQEEVKDGFADPIGGRFAGRQRDIDFDLFELGAQTPGFGTNAAHFYGDLAIGIPVLHLDRLQTHGDELRRPLLIHDRQHFLGAGPHAGLNWEIPTIDHWFINGRLETGLYWGGFNTREDQVRLDGPIDLTLETYRQEKGGILAQAGGEVGVTYLYQGDTYRLFFSSGFRYSTWFSNDLWALEGITMRRGRIEQAGPYFRFVFQY